MSLWTMCPVKVNMPSQSSYKDYAEVYIPDGKHYGRSSSSWSSSPQQVTCEYAAFLQNLKTQIIILFSPTEQHDEAWLARTFKNGLALRYKFDSSRSRWGASGTEEKVQLHVYPLTLFPWFFKRYWKDNENDPVLFVDGKLVRWTNDVCFNCPQLLERSLQRCRVGHENCNRPLVSEVVLPAKEWIDAHATMTDNIEGFTFKPIKEMTVLAPFEKFSIQKLVDDPVAVTAMQRDRSAKAVKAAQSRFVKATACPQCLISSQCFSYRYGGSYCPGLHLPEDYDHLHEKCEPWMAHVMLLTQHELIAAKQIKEWKRLRAPAFVLRPALAPKTELTQTARLHDDSRRVIVMRDCYDNPWMSMPYLSVCELLNVQPVHTWDKLPISYKQSRSLRAVAYALTSGAIRGSTRVSGGWGTRSVELVQIKVNAARFVQLTYNNNRHSNRWTYDVNEATFYEDVIKLPGLERNSSSDLSPQRKAENMVFEAAIFQRRLNITVNEVKDAVQRFSMTAEDSDQRSPAMYAWLEERSKERWHQRRRSSKQPATSAVGEKATVT